jgi:hypothetical protein
MSIGFIVMVLVCFSFVIAGANQRWDSDEKPQAGGKA